MSNVVVHLPLHHLLNRLKGRLFTSQGEAILLIPTADATLPIRLRETAQGHTKLSADRVWERGNDEETQLALLRVAEEVGSPFSANKIKQVLLRKREKRPKPTPFSSMRRCLVSAGVESLLKPGEGVLEIGCGNGLFLAHLLREGKNAVGLEISNRCLRKAAFRLKEAGFAPTTRFLVKADAAAFLLYMVPPGFLDKIYLLFPDPWDGNPERRLISKGFLELARERLRLGGRTLFATDHAGYFAQVKRLAAETEGIEPAGWEEPLKTKYHSKWKQEGRSIHKIALEVRRHTGDPGFEKAGKDLSIDAPGFNPGNLKLPLVLTTPHKDTFVVEKSYHGDSETLLRTILNPSVGMTQKQFLLFKNGALSLLPTWHEVATTPLRSAVELLASNEHTPPPEENPLKKPDAGAKKDRSCLR